MDAEKCSFCMHRFWQIYHLFNNKVISAVRWIFLQKDSIRAYIPTVGLGLIYPANQKSVAIKFSAGLTQRSVGTVAGCLIHYVLFSRLLENICYVVTAIRQALLGIDTKHKSRPGDYIYETPFVKKLYRTY